MALPRSIHPEHIDSTIEILNTKVKGATIEELKTINSNLNSEIIDSTIFLGIVKKEGKHFLLTEFGRKYASEQINSQKQQIFQNLLKKISIYNLTIEKLYYEKNFKVTKMDVGSYWNQSFKDDVKELNEENLLATVIFFFRTIERAGLGKFVAAGKGRESRIDLNQVEVTKYVTKGEATENIEPNGQTIISVFPDLPAEETISDETFQSENNEGEGFELAHLRALKRINFELTWKELDSPGAKKLLIDKMAELSTENTVLNAKVEQYQILDKEAAVLQEKVQTLSKENLWKASVNSIGGIILGASISIADNTLKISGCILGALLIAISILLTRNTKEKDQE